MPRSPSKPVKSTAVANDSRFRSVAAFWTLTEHPGPGSREWSLARKLRSLRDSGFTALCSDLGEKESAIVREAGIEPVGLVFGHEPDRYPALIAAAARTGAKIANLQLMNPDLPTAEALRRWILLERLAADAGIELSLETHRATVTETPAQLFALASRYEQKTGRLLRLTWDFSHIGVVKHFEPARVAELCLTRSDLIAHASQFHFRPFNGQHAQIPVARQGKLTAEIAPYLEFVTGILRIWKAAPANRTRLLYACPELGPVPGGYALTSFPKSWPDAVRLQRELEACWRAA